MNIELNPRVSAKNPANIGATAPMILCGRKSNANPFVVERATQILDLSGCSVKGQP